MSLLLLSKCFTKLDAYERDETSLCMDHMNVCVHHFDRQALWSSNSPKAKLWAYREENIKPTRTPSLTLKAKLFTCTFLVYSYLHIIIIFIRHMCRYVHLMFTKLILNDLDIKWMWMLTQNNKKPKILRRKTPTIMTRIIPLIFQKYAKLQHLTVNLTSSRCRETISQDDCCFHL